MMKFIPVLAACLVVTAFAVRARGDGPAHGKRVVGYFTEWNAEYDVDKLRPDLLTHVIYAFAVIKNGEIAISNPENAIEREYSGDTADTAFKGRFRQLQLL